jgi:4-hydroxy-tetrahydrodipicolinate reductase
LAKTLNPQAPIVAGRGDTGDVAGAIHIHSIRIGDIPGEHQVQFASDDEVITLTHRAISREAFARGAIRAAKFLASRDRGLFSMEDLLGKENA